MSESEDTWNNLIYSSSNSRNEPCSYADEDRARQYNDSVLIWEDAYQRVQNLAPDPSWSVLEIGPGPGVMTIPLAQRVKSVTVVEPAVPMAAYLKDHLSENNISNVRIIQKRWEMVDRGEIEVHDLVLASYSLDMTDIRESIQKMIDHAKREVHLWWFSGVTSWEKVRIDISGQEDPLFPKADLLMHIISEMGYLPKMEELVGTSFPNRYTNREDADRRMKNLLNLKSCDPLPDEVIRYIEENWRRENGEYRHEDTTTYVHITIPTGTGE